MTELVFHNLQWCSQHGHPFLILRTSRDNRYLVFSISVDDAMAMADTPLPTLGSARTHHLLESTLTALGARLDSVELHISPDRSLHAELHIDRAGHHVSLPVYFVDGLALARRSRAPVHIADADLERVPTQTTPNHVRQGFHPPEPFRRVIDALDLSGLGHDERGPDATFA